MIDENHIRRSPSQSADKDQHSATNLGAMHVENVTQSKSVDGDDQVEFEQGEKVLRVEQDARVEKSKQEAQGVGERSDQPKKNLNQDG